MTSPHTAIRKGTPQGWPRFQRKRGQPRRLGALQVLAESGQQATRPQLRHRTNPRHLDPLVALDLTGRIIADLSFRTNIFQRRCAHTRNVQRSQESLKRSAMAPHNSHPQGPADANRAATRTPQDQAQASRDTASDAYSRAERAHHEHRPSARIGARRA